MDVPHGYRRYAAAGVVLVGAASVLIVSWSGAAGWRLVRGTVVAVVALGAARLVVRAGPLAAALVTLAIGSTATALGLGIGPAWLSKDGWSLLALAGLVDLFVGLALLLGGTVALIARTPGWWRLVAVPVARSPSSPSSTPSPSPRRPPRSRRPLWGRGHPAISAWATTWSP